MAVCDGCGRDLAEVKTLTRRGLDGELRTSNVCRACRPLAESYAERVEVSREKMLEARWKADHREQLGSLAWGQRIVSYREWMTGDLYSGGHWMAQLVLGDGTRVLLEERERGGG